MWRSQPNNIQTQRILVTLAERPYPFPSRTRKSSSPAPKILRGQPFGNIGRRQDFVRSETGMARGASAPGPFFDSCYIRCAAGDSVPLSSPAMDPIVQDDHAAPPGAIGPCPFLIAASGEWRLAMPDKEHRCGAFAPLTVLALEKQGRLCLTPGHPQCQTYIASLEARE